ncbi:MAG: isoprenylcysteine carboxylmethyltransferase family protein [Planctomycetes bacterium]|nr:isoprenylcysteine carboxylmethyltransferase family protein [Planctomycetota bacterium]
MVQLLWNGSCKMMVKIGNFFFRYRNALFPLVFVLLFFERRWPVFNSELAERWEIGIGIVVALSGQILRALTIGLAYIKRGGKKKQVYAEKLVQNGIFAHCRNPLYLGNLLILFGVGIAANSLPFVLFGIPFFLFAYLAIIHAEENYLEKKFGQEFKDYCKRVNRIIPNFSRIGNTIKSMEFNWKRLIVKEYATPFAWITGLTFLIIKDTYLDHGYEASKYTLWSLSILLLVATCAFFTAWYLKKNKFLRSN